MQKTNEAKHGDDKAIGPSKEMIAALKAQGLNIAWPEYIYAPIKVTYTTKTRPTEEKCVVIDLHCFEEKGFATEHDVDWGIVEELYSTYMGFNWEYEANKSPEPRETIDDIVRLYEDKQEQEKRLYRFQWVATAVVKSRDMSTGEWQSPFDEEFHIRPEVDAEMDRYLERTCPKLVPGSGIWERLIAPLCQQPGSGEHFNGAN